MKIILLVLMVIMIFRLVVDWHIQNGSKLIVGYTYHLCSQLDESNVIIIEKRNGYVRYIWDYDSVTVNPVNFTRTYNEFYELIEECK